MDLRLNSNSGDWQRAGHMHSPWRISRAVFIWPIRPKLGSEIARVELMITTVNCSLGGGNRGLPQPSEHTCAAEVWTREQPSCGHMLPGQAPAPVLGNWKQNQNGTRDQNQWQAAACLLHDCHQGPVSSSHTSFDHVQSEFAGVAVMHCNPPSVKHTHLRWD